MNNRAALERIEALLDQSGFVTTLVEGAEREPQGLKTSVEAIRLLMIGLLLSIPECKTATITGAHDALIRYVDFRDQLRLGIRTGPGPRDVISRRRLYYAADFLSRRLTYGPSVADEIGEAEVVRRREVVLRATNALLDYTSAATDVDHSRLAIDATAVWSWARGKFYPKPTAAEIAAQQDELVREELAKLAAGRGDVSDLEGAAVAADSGQLEGGDPDAAWSGATAKNGGCKRFYGYFAHVACVVPGSKREDDPSAVAPIVRRVELIRATDDVVDVTLRMIDSLETAPLEVLVDRHYSYKEFHRWQSPLLTRGIRQVLDLRSDDHDTFSTPEGIHADGAAHCPATPSEFFGLHRPGLFASWEEHETFQRRMTERRRYAHGVINLMDRDSRTKLRCPARDYRVACPLYAPSMAVAAELGLPIVNTDLLELEPGEAPPRCCTQDSFRMTLPEPVAKLNQSTYWGTKEWYDAFAGRTYVEGVFGNLKNPRTENLKRGTVQKTGLVWAQLMVALICATYNVRVIRERHARLGRPWTGHALLSPDADTVTHVSLSRENEHRLITDHIAGASLDELEIRPLGSSSDTDDQRIASLRQRPTRDTYPAFWVSQDARTAVAL